MQQTIVDAQSVKNTLPASCKGYDGGKKISGIKRTLVVDTLGGGEHVTVHIARRNELHVG